MSNQDRRYRITLFVLIMACAVAAGAGMVLTRAQAQTAFPCTQALGTPPTNAQVTACLEDIRKQSGDVANAMARQKARIDALAARFGVEPTPEPPPPPVVPPVIPPASGIAIDGLAVAPAPLGTITTPTGAWPVARLGEGAYLFGYAGKADWWSVCITRQPDGDGTIDEMLYSVSVGGVAYQVRVLPGSMKCVDNGEPVAPDMARLKAAVAANRVIAYGKAAFAGFPAPAWALDKREGADLYRADRIYWRTATYDKTFGGLTGNAGEAPSSRGFVSEDDAVMIAAAVDGDAEIFAKAAARNRVQMLYGLSIPNLAIWSTTNDMLRDPQLPLGGDKGYANEGTQPGVDQYGNEGSWKAPADYPYLAELGATAGTVYPHTRDEAHLFNHGYAYWLATGDPRAAILQQAIMAYVLASNYQRTPDKYRPRFSYQRTTLNQFTAMWKLRDVALNASGPLLWDRGRADKIVTDMWAGWEADISGMDAASDIHGKSSSIFRGIDRNDDSGYSGWMIHAYGPEVAYLWALSGRPALMQRIAENTRLRFEAIGGALGYWGPVSTSAFTLIPAGAATLPYDDAISFAAWTKAADVNSRSTTSFATAPPHYTIRAYWAAKMAQAAGISGMEATIAAMESARAATPSWSGTGNIGWKHAGVVQ